MFGIDFDPIGAVSDFVTGGKSVDPKMVAPNEFRGTMIEGGETRELKKGDVVIVPKGTPLGARITGSDWNEGGLSPDDAVAFSKALKENTGPAKIFFI